MDRLQQALATSARHQRSGGAWLLLDLDNFKTRMKPPGPRPRRRCCCRYRTACARLVHERTTVARQGGDEFVV